MELDDKILEHAMKTFGLTKEEAQKEVQQMIDMGILKKADVPDAPCDLQVTAQGAKVAEQAIIDQYGEFKKIMDLESGKWHRVPTIVIIREGIRQEDLKDFPPWTD